MKNSILVFLFIGVIYLLMSNEKTRQNSTVLINDYKHIYEYDQNGAIISILTTSNVKGAENGTLVQKLTFSSSGILENINIIANTKEKAGVVLYDEHALSLDSNKNVISYKISRDFKTVNAQRYDSKRNKYVSY